MSEFTVSSNVSVETSTARARRHREKLKTDCARLDVTTGRDVAEKLNSLANQKGVPKWQVVQDAIEALHRAHVGV